MAAVPKKLKFMLFGLGPGFQAPRALALGILAGASLVVGIVSGFMDKALGMRSTDWLLASIALFIAALWTWLTAYFAAKE